MRQRGGPRQVRAGRGEVIQVNEGPAHVAMGAGLTGQIVQALGTGERDLLRRGQFMPLASPIEKWHQRQGNCRA